MAIICHMPYMSSTKSVVLHTRTLPHTNFKLKSHLISDKIKKNHLAISHKAINFIIDERMIRLSITKNNVYNQLYCLHLRAKKKGNHMRSKVTTIIEI